MMSHGCSAANDTLHMTDTVGLQLEGEEGITAPVSKSQS